MRTGLVACRLEQAELVEHRAGARADAEQCRGHEVGHVVDVAAQGGQRPGQLARARIEVGLARGSAVPRIKGVVGRGVHRGADAGGVRDGHQLKFWTPGGSSTPLLTAEHLDVPLDFEAVASAGSMLGTRALQIFDDSTCVVRAVLRWTEFYKHESCGKCTPCREGTWWLVQTLAALERGEGQESDLELLLDQCDNILGRAFCALGDGATSPITEKAIAMR